MLGYVDRVDIGGRLVHGWAVAGRDQDNTRTRVVVYLDGESIGEAHPDRLRADLNHITQQVGGFSIAVRDGVRALDFAAGRVQVRATHGEDTGVLKVTERTASALRGAAIDELRPGTSAADDPRRPVPVVSLDAVSRASLTRGLLSPLLVPVGHESHDGTARVGQAGHLFLTGGSNNLSALYADDTDYGPVTDRTGKVRQWLDVFAGRAAGCEARGVTYLQTLIPEKSTALRHLAPTPITAPTPLLERLHESLLAQSCYLDGLELWEKWDDLGDAPYFEPDTHFSPAGAKRFFLGLVEALGAGGLSEVEEVELDATRVRRGDLSDRFGAPIYARSWEPSREVTETLGRQVEVVYRKPSASRAVGSRYAFRNSAAPIDLKVLVFGNSFFQNGDFAHHLSWWAKHFFADFTFVWEPDVDWALVDELAPDVVVGQTIERFLPRVATT